MRHYCTAMCIKVCSIYQVIYRFVLFTEYIVIIIYFGIEQMAHTSYMQHTSRSKSYLPPIEEGSLSHSHTGQDSKSNNSLHDDDDVWEQNSMMDRFWLWLIYTWDLLANLVCSVIVHALIAFWQGAVNTKYSVLSALVLWLARNNDWQ